MPQRREPARHGGGLEAAGIEVGEIVAQCLGFDVGKTLAAAGQEPLEIREIAAVGVQRVVAGALFRREHVEEQVDQLGI